VAAAPAPTPAPVTERTGLAQYSDAVRDEHSRSMQRIRAVVQAARASQPLARREDERLLRGKGQYVDDYRPAGMLYMAVVRSPYAHARIRSIDLSRAEALPGVVCTLTGAEVAAQTDPFIQIGPDPSARIKDYAL